MPISTNDKIRLTTFAHGAGCGCKIAPSVLQEILQSGSMPLSDSRLLVGSSTNDDAAVYELADGSALIATTDFFMPIVDDAYDFGCIAAANAISDVYAMGGKPFLALAILGWPVNKLPASLAARVMEGARAVCSEAGIVLAGGHSIDTTEPVFGLSVNGIAEKKNLKLNSAARPGDLLFLTKPLGTGIMATAQKRAVLTEEDLELLTKQLKSLNSIGEKLGQYEDVHAVTDVTGFGLLGHLTEMCEGSNCSALIDFSSLPLMQNLLLYIEQGIMPDNTFRNWNAYQQNLALEEQVNASHAFSVLADPQTNGGLLFSVHPSGSNEIISLLKANGLENFCRPIGVMTGRSEKLIVVRP